jgi:hypothetical protein
MSKCARIMQLELWTVLFAEIQKGSNTRAACCCCCCCAYASNLFLIIPILLGICDRNTDDSIANTEINLTTDVEYLGSYDDDFVCYKFSETRLENHQSYLYVKSYTFYFLKVMAIYKQTIIAFMLYLLQIILIFDA